jgi:hypothetical protein
MPYESMADYVESDTTTPSTTTGTWLWNYI